MQTNATAANNYDLPRVFRAQVYRTPLLDKDETASAFVALRALHNAAWDACLAAVPTIEDERGNDNDWSALRAAVAAASKACAVREADAQLTRTVNAICAANLRLCIYVATTEFRRSSMELDDRVQHASLGCLRAIRTFDPARDLRFSTYATWWIRHAIGRAEQDTVATIRIPVHVHETRRVVAKTVRELAKADPSTTPAVPAIVERTGRTVRQVRAALTAPRTISADRVVGETIGEEDGRTLLDFLPAESADPVEYIDENRRAVALVRGVDHLPARTADVMRRRLGVRDGRVGAQRVETLDVIAERLNISRERVRQIERDGAQALQVVIPALMRPEVRRTARQRNLLAQAK